MTDLTLEHAADALTILSERFGRAVSPQLARIYHSGWQQLLSRDDLARGIGIVVFEDTYWPSPARVLEAATRSIDDAAANAWTELLESTREDRRHALDSIASATLRDLGGASVAKSWDAQTVLRVRPQFLTEYSRRARAARAEIIAPRALPTGGAA